jgi:hypothetical protein
MKKTKMKLTGFLAFALLSISILSYGVSGAAFADSHNLPPISVSSELTIYSNGSNVVVSGDIRKIIVSARKEYTTNEPEAIGGLKYRVYVTQGTTQIDTVPWTSINKAYNQNYFIIGSWIFFLLHSVAWRYFVRRINTVYHIHISPIAIIRRWRSHDST